MVYFMVPWVVINRQHLPRPARGTRLARMLCSIRVLPLPALLFNVPTGKPLNVLTSPILPRAHSHFGSHPSLISEKTSPFFSYTCVEPILQPFCFQIHACNGGGCTPLGDSTAYPLPLIPCLSRAKSRDPLSFHILA